MDEERQEAPQGLEETFRESMARELYVQAFTAAAATGAAVTVEEVARGAFIGADVFLEEAKRQRDPKHRRATDLEAAGDLRAELTYRPVMIRADGKVVRGGEVKSQSQAVAQIEETARNTEIGTYDEALVEIRGRLRVELPGGQTI